MKLLKEIFKNNKNKTDEIFLSSYELYVRRKKRFYLRLAGFILAVLIILFVIYFTCVYKNLNELIGYLK
tara:strand:+ start:1526 stop:1732 length:207 start_codon:yes stop_codon:yes gene_type:complete